MCSVRVPIYTQFFKKATNLENKASRYMDVKDWKVTNNPNLPSPLSPSQFMQQKFSEHPLPHRLRGKRWVGPTPYSQELHKKKLERNTNPTVFPCFLLQDSWSESCSETYIILRLHPPQCYTLKLWVHFISIVSKEDCVFEKQIYPKCKTATYSGQNFFHISFNI